MVGKEAITHNLGYYNMEFERVVYHNIYEAMRNETTGHAGHQRNSKNISPHFRDRTVGSGRASRGLTLMGLLGSRDYDT